MAINKVILNGEVKVDLTDTTAMPEDVLEDKVFYNAKGERVIGTGTGGIKSGIEIPLEGFNLGNNNSSDCNFIVTIPEGVTDLTTMNLFNDGVQGIWHMYIPESLNYIGEDIIYSGGQYSIYKIYVKDFSKFAHACLYDKQRVYGAYFSQASYADYDGNPITVFEIPYGCKVLPYDFINTYSNCFFTDMRYFHLILPETIEDCNMAIDYGYFIPCTIEIKNSIPPSLSASYWTYMNGPADHTIIVPAGSLDTYKTATNWSNFTYAMIEKGAPTEWLFFDTKNSSDPIYFSYNDNITWQAYIDLYPDSGFSVDENDRVLYNGEAIFTDYMGSYSSYYVYAQSYIKNIQYMV